MATAALPGILDILRGQDHSFSDVWTFQSPLLTSLDEETVAARDGLQAGCDQPGVDSPGVWATACLALQWVSHPVQVCGLQPASPCSGYLTLPRALSGTPLSLMLWPWLEPGPGLIPHEL